MLKFGNKEFRNLQEQVLKNMQNIANIKEGTAVLSEFGIKVVGEVDTLADLPSVADYKAAHEDWEYGDAFAVGTTAPYSLYILTRENDSITVDHWFDIGDFPAPGPQGQQGPQGEVGPQGQQGNQGEPGVDAGFGSVLATAQTLPAGSVATATVTASGPNTAKEFSFTFGIPRGADGGQASWGNILGDIEDQTDLQDALDSKQDELVSGTNIKTINNQSIVGEGNIEINSGVWGNITGTLSDQTDLQTALNAKANMSSLATVATTGNYDDLSNKPTIGVGTITIKKNGNTVDAFGVNQTTNQDINIVVPTKTSDLSNDSDFTSKTYVDDELALKQDVISDLSDIRSGAALGATALQSVPSEYITDSELATELATKQDVISDLSNIRAGAALGNTAVQPATLQTELATKQDTISDLATIRSNAALGATAVQPASLTTALSEYTKTSDLATVATSGSYNDLSNKPTIPTATSELTNDSGFITSSDIPTNVSSFTNDAGYITSSDLPTNYVTTDTAQTIIGKKTFIADNASTSVVIKPENSTAKHSASMYVFDIAGSQTSLVCSISNNSNASNLWMQQTNGNGFNVYPAASSNNGSNLGTTNNRWSNLNLSNSIDITKTVSGYSESKTTINNAQIKTSATPTGGSASYVEMLPTGTIGLHVHEAGSTNTDTTYRADYISVGSTNPKIVNLPSASGTLALTSEIPTNVVNTTDSQTITGLKTFNNNNGIKIVVTGRTPINESNIFVGGLQGGLSGLILNARDNSGTTTYAGSIGIVPEQETANRGVYLVPITDGVVKDLGRQGKEWRNLYLSGNITDGTNSTTVANIASKTDVSTAIAGQTKETWTFTLSDGTTTTKTIVLG